MSSFFVTYLSWHLLCIFFQPIGVGRWRTVLFKRDSIRVGGSVISVKKNNLIGILPILLQFNKSSHYLISRVLYLILQFLEE